MNKRLRSGPSLGPLRVTQPSDGCACHPAADALANVTSGGDTGASLLQCSEAELNRKRRNVRVLAWVLLLNAFTMVAEIGVGFWSHSLALTADGWHMLGHTVALGLTFFVMSHLVKVQTRLARKALQSAKAENSCDTDADKDADAALAERALLVRLARRERFVGVVNAALLVAVGGYTIFDAVRAFFHPHAQEFTVALGVASAGLVVNLAGGFALHGSHDKGNVAERGMYLHIASDALMSLFAICALSAGEFLGVARADPVVGVLGGLVIVKWGASLLAQGLRL